MGADLVIQQQNILEDTGSGWGSCWIEGAHFEDFHGPSPWRRPRPTKLSPRARQRAHHARMPILTSSRRTRPSIKKPPESGSSSTRNPQNMKSLNASYCGVGMLGIVVDGGDEGAMQFMSKLTLYEATSLGGVESLIEVPHFESHGRRSYRCRHRTRLRSDQCWY